MTRRPKIKPRPTILKKGDSFATKTPSEKNSPDASNEKKMNSIAQSGCNRDASSLVKSHLSDDYPSNRELLSPTHEKDEPQDAPLLHSECSAEATVNYDNPVDSEKFQSSITASRNHNDQSIMTNSSESIKKMEVKLSSNENVSESAFIDKEKVAHENDMAQTSQPFRRRKLQACPTIAGKKRKVFNTNKYVSQKSEQSSDSVMPSSSQKLVESSDVNPLNSQETQEAESNSLLNETNRDSTPVLGSSIHETKIWQEKDSLIKKSTVPGGRRRKVVARPAIGKKRPKTDPKSCENDNPDKKLSVNVVSSTVEGSSDTSHANFHLSVETMEIGGGTVEEATTDVAALTTVSSEILEQQTIPKSPIYGITNCIDDNSNELCGKGTYENETMVGFTGHKEVLSVDNILNQSKTMESPLKKQSTKDKTISQQQKNKALQKLKKLQQDQGDASKWPELDQNYVSMSDLIYLNPPAEVGHKLGMNAEQKKIEDQCAALDKSSRDETAPSEVQVDEAPLPVPQIRIAEDGTVVVDEESLVLDTRKPVDPGLKTVYESGRDNFISQHSFRRRPLPRPTRWSNEDTNKFYRCLGVVGTEFSMMSAMFHSRSSDDLRRKFRRERKLNPTRVDEALMHQHLTKWTDDMFEPSQPNDPLLKSPEQTVK